MSLPPEEVVPPGTRVHVIAIGGVMMSAIARLLAAHGCRVSGSDLSRSPYTDALQAEGLAVTVGPHDAGHLPEECGLVTYSSAVPETNPELVAARERGIPALKRSQMLGRIVNPRRGLAVAGTHGKTTTSGLAATILVEAGWEPTFLVGSVVANYRTNAVGGRGEWVVVEADEYDRAFLDLTPEVAVVTNLENDHPDIYTDFDDLYATFARFVGLIKPGGSLILGADCPRAIRLASESAVPVHTYGFADTADWRVVDWSGGRACFRLRCPDGIEREVTTRLLGRHNVLNTAAAIAAASAAGLAVEQAVAGAAAFGGTERRLELLIEADGVRVVDDYAHHPTEVAATIAAVRALGGRLRVVFEPHQYARTRALLNDYAGAFAGCDEALITDIYRARESDLSGISSARLAEVAGPPASYVGGAEAAFERLTATAGEDETWLIMGAGTITETAHQLAEWVRRRP